MSEKKENKPAPKKPAGKKLTKSDLLKYNVQKIALPTVKACFNGDENQAFQHMAGISVALSGDPNLLLCTADSIARATIKSARLQLDVSGVTGEAYFVKFANEAVLIIGYNGFVKLLYDAGITKIQGDIVREKDEASYENGEFRHKVDINLSKEERGAAIGAYVRVTYKGETNTKYMNAKDILSHGKKFSKSFHKKDSAWNEDKDPELNQWKKTVLLQMVKFLPKSRRLQESVETDHAADSKIHTDADKQRLDAFETSEALRMKNLGTGNHEKENDQQETEQAAEGNEAQ